MLANAWVQISLKCSHWCRNSRNRGRNWAKRQVRPYRCRNGTVWSGAAFACQCFFGFKELECENAGVPCEFGGFLPNTAIEGVSAWLEARQALEQVILQFDVLVLCLWRLLYLRCRAWGDSAVCLRYVKLCILRAVHQYHAKGIPLQIPRHPLPWILKHQTGASESECQRARAVLQVA